MPLKDISFTLNPTVVICNMNLLKNISFWILLCVALSVICFFINYLLTPESRRKQRYKVQIFFGKIVDSVDKTKLTNLQKLMVKYVITSKNMFFGEKILTRRLFIHSLVCSQFLTLTALVLSNLYDRGRIIDFNFLNLIPIFPFLGFSFICLPQTNAISLLESVGLFWNNYLFDLLAIVSTVILLKMAYERKIWFSLAALIDISISYLLSYLCIVFYFITPPHSGNPNLNFFTFLPDIWTGKIFLSTFPTMWVFYSLTTFVPIILYMSVLLSFSLCKGLKYVCAPLAEKYSKDDERTIFFSLGSGFAILAILLKAIEEFTN